MGRNNLYFVIQITKNGKHYAYIDEVNKALNLYGLFEGRHEFGGRKIDSVMYMPSKKRALEIAEAWNNIFKNEGTLIDWRKAQ